MTPENDTAVSGDASVIRSVGSSGLAFRAFLPERPAANPLVLVHGRHRSADRLLKGFLPVARLLDLPLIAPVFSLGDFPRYQLLSGPRGAWDAEARLVDLVAEVGPISSEGIRFSLFGHSGGAQFAHRFAMRRPGLLDAAVISAAGWYTYLDTHRDFPDGVRSFSDSALDGFLALPLLVAVGEDDTRRDRSLRTGRVDSTQGGHRLSRAVRWVEHLRTVSQARGIASRVDLWLPRGVGHDLESVLDAGMAQRVAAHLLAGSAWRRPEEMA